MLHSGSRNIGNEVATRHIATAKSLHDLNTLPAADLAYSVYMERPNSRRTGTIWNGRAVSFATLNREIMMKRLVRSFNRMFNDEEEFEPEVAVNCHHNYVAIEQHFDDEVFITRKGAINAGGGSLWVDPRLDGSEIFHHQRTREF